MEFLKQNSFNLYRYNFIYNLYLKNNIKILDKETFNEG